MIDPKKITPLLSNMTVEQELGRGPNGTVYLVTRKTDGKKLALKHIPIPASDAQTKALIFAGAVSNETDAQRYYSSLVQEIKAELLWLNSIPTASNLLKVRGYQADQKIIGIGHDVYILSDYCQSLSDYLRSHPITHLQAINLAIDLSSALEQLRSVGLIHKDVHPNNIFLNANRHFMLGDLGLVKLSDLAYSSMPDHLVTAYCAPEVTASDAFLSETMDIYSVGMILYEVYNGGLPVDSEETPSHTDGLLPAPAYADAALADIILRACAADPGARYQNPSEMKQALMLHLQRGNITNAPLVPSAYDAEASGELDVSVIAATVEAGRSADGTSPLSTDAEGPPADETDENDYPDFSEVPKEPGAGQKVSLNDLDENTPLFPPNGEISVEDFLASVRTKPGIEVVSMDNDGNTVSLPGYETEATLPKNTEFVDSADNRSGVSAEPETAAVSHSDESDISSPAAPVISESETDIPPSGKPEQTVEPPVTERPRRRYRPLPPGNDDVNVYDDGYADDGIVEDTAPPSPWKKVLISVIILLVLAGGAFALYTLKTDTIKSMKSEVLSSSSVHISAETRNGSAVDVVCSNAAGEIARISLGVDGATFTDLNPSTSYMFSLESSAGKLLLGSKRLEAKTEQMTNLTGFAAVSCSAVSVNLSLGGTGSQPEAWVVTLTSDSGETITTEAAGTDIYVEGLTPATTYTATLSRSDGDALGGITTCTFTTMDYTVLAAYEAVKVDTEGVSLQWNYTGTVPDNWVVTCQGTDGSSTQQEVAGTATECSFDGLTPGVTYTLSLYCASLQETEMSIIEATIPTTIITEISSTLNDDGNIEVSWDYTGDTTPTQWSVSYAYNATTPVTPMLVTSDTASVVLENLLPNAAYTIKVVGADDLGVGGDAETTCSTREASQYTNYGCMDPSLSLYVLEDNPDELETPSTTFTTDQHIAFSIQVSYTETEEDKSAETIYVIRNSEKTPVYVYTSNRSWPGTWTTAKHNGNLPDMPQEAGNYTLEVYFDGCFLASASFSVS